MTSEDSRMESVVVAGVAADKKTVKLTIDDVPDEPGMVAQIFERLAEENVSVDMIIQNVSFKGRTDITFTVSEEDQARADKIAHAAPKRSAPAPSRSTPRSSKSRLSA